MARRNRRDAHAFSVELNSKRYLTTVKLGSSNGANGGKILLEGSLGRLTKMGLIEDSMLEIDGSRGTFRLDIKESEIRRLLGRETVDLDR